ncbi:MAG: PilZ domain-containing protein, partial [Candidatus Methylomirabilota bacterium]
MAEVRERRRVPRTPITGELGARARSTLDVRLLDLSTFGARIEHLDLLRPGSACTFELPPSIGALTLSARIIHSSVVGAAPTREGERKLRYQSGLVFTGITVDQQTTLEGALQKLTSIGSSRNTRFSM